MNLFPIFMIGLLGGAHCVGMCGGIVSALSVAPGARRFPVPVIVTDKTAALRVIAYNGGRIASYVAAGAIAGGLAAAVRTFSVLSSIQIGGYWFANLMLVALGLYLMDVWRGVTQLEVAGKIVWRHVQPLTRRLLPMDSPGKALLLGALWGWIPCGMVYGVLLSAMATGSAAAGASVMFAFGLGTLPVLLTMGLLGVRLQEWTRRRPVRIACGMIVLLFGLLGLWRAAGGVHLGWLDALCLSPGAGGR